MDMSKTIRIRCKAADVLDPRELVIIQGALKSLSKSSYEKFKRSILRFGVISPVHVWVDQGINKVLDGTHRTKAFLQMILEGYECPKVPVTYLDADNEKEARAMILALVSQYAKIETDGLYEFMTESEISMEEINADFELPDFDAKRFEAEFFTNAISEDEVPEPPKVAITKPGDLWELGDHRLLCGDSSDPEIALSLFGGAQMCFTDPPYGVNYEEKATNILGRTDRATIQGDGDGKAVLETTVRRAFENIQLMLAEGAAYYVCSPQGGELGLMMMMQEAGIPCRHMIVWAKDSPVFSMGRLDYDYQHEPILYGWKGSHKHVGLGTFRTSVWSVPRPKVSKLHPTMKPVELVVNAIRNSVNRGDVVLDLFGGSGTTVIAAQHTETKARMVEIDPLYCDVIVERWQNLTGGKATRKEGDQTSQGIAMRKRMEAKGVYL